jgi:hypothetical protein
MPTHRVTKLVYLDKITKCYKNIFGMPNPPPNDISLNMITKTISRNKLSPFETFSACDNRPSCLRVFINNNGETLTENEVGILFSQIIDAGFTIEYEMTKLVKDKKLVCFISKN